MPLTKSSRCRGQLILRNTCRKQDTVMPTATLFSDHCLCQQNKLHYSPSGTPMVHFYKISFRYNKSVPNSVNEGNVNKKKNMLRCLCLGNIHFHLRPLYVCICLSRQCLNLFSFSWGNSTRNVIVVHLMIHKLHQCRAAAT